MKQWSDEFCMGIEEIDQDHRNMFEMVDRLYAATEQGKETEEIRSVLTFLEVYVREHFRREEEYMDRYAYPLAELHKEKHHGFVQEFLRVRDEFDRDSEAGYLSLLVEGWLYSWMDDHFSRDDRELGRFLKARIDASQAAAH